MSTELNKEIQKCVICNKEIKNEWLLRVNEKSICYDCTEKIIDVYDGVEESTADVNVIYADPEKVVGSKTKSKRVSEVYDVEKIVKKVRRSVKGQDELVKRVAFTLLKNQKYPNRKSNILIVGNSGMGKTQTLKSVLEATNVPYFIEDITSYTEAGYVGRDIDEIVLGLCTKYNFNKSQVERGVIVIDEFDKLAANSSYGKDVSGEGVQKSLLKVLEGKVVNAQMSPFGSTISIDTSKITFVLLGVFPSINEIRKKRLKIGKTNSIGFVESNSENQEYVNSAYIAEDFEKAGFMTEVIGRVKVFLEANELTEKDFYEILTKSNLSALSNIRAEFKERKIWLIIKKGTLEMIAKKALSYKTGARAINTVLEDTFSEVLYELESHPKKIFKTCIINPETVQDKTKYILH